MYGNWLIGYGIFFNLNMLGLVMVILIVIGLYLNLISVCEKIFIIVMLGVVIIIVVFMVSCSVISVMVVIMFIWLFYIFVLGKFGKFIVVVVVISVVFVFVYSMDLIVVFIDCGSSYWFLIWEEILCYV